MKTSSAAVYVAPFALFLVVYLLLARHGFMIDDYAWVVQSRVRSIADLAALFTHTNGFYRPLVALTFTVNEWLFGHWAFGYGMTNVALALGCAAAIAALGRALGLSKGAAIVFSSLWLLNLQGIRTAVLWVSGRSALVLVLCATMSALSVVRGRRVASFVWLAAALLSKEEALLLPAVLLAWIFVLRRDDREDTVSSSTWTAGSVAIAVVYLLARYGAHAMTFASAPPYYQLGFVPHVVWRHAYLYADQIATFSILVTLSACLLFGAWPRVDRRTMTFAALGALWVVGGYGLTLFVPARSDLYSCLPSVGVCLVAAVVCEEVWQRAAPRRRSLALTASLAACVALSPVYYVRTLTRSHVIEFGSSAIADISAAVAALPEGTTVVVFDDQRARSNNRPNLEDAFGSMLNEAYEMTTDRRLQFEIALPPDETSDPVTPAAMYLRLVDGRVRGSTIDGR